MSILSANWRDLAWPHEGPKFNLCQLWETSMVFKMTVLTPKWSILRKLLRRSRCTNNIMLSKILKVATEPISQMNFQNNLSCRKSGALRLNLKFTLQRNYVN